MIAVRETVNGKRMLSFLEQHADTSSKLEVILFLSRHPRMKFSFEAVAARSGASRDEMAESMRFLVGAGVMREEIGSDQVAWYSLTHDEQKRQSVEDLSRLNVELVKSCWKNNVLMGAGIAQG
jgi:hypothetical protein